MNHRIMLNGEDTVELVLEDGQVINMQLEDIDDGGILPELIIWFEQDMVANCWLEGLAYGKPLRGSPNAVLMRQIDIPIEPRVLELNNA